MMFPMGAWGPALWSDDLAVDVRSDYREALEDGLSDEAAAARMVGRAPARTDDEYVVFWIALAVAQHNLGRLTAEVRETAVAAIDSGDDLRRWVDADAKALAKRVTVLAKVRQQLLSPQPERKKVRPPPRKETDLVPGDVLAYQTASGRTHLLVVRAVTESRYGRFPVVQLLDYHGIGVPALKKIAKLPNQQDALLHRGGQVAARWWLTAGAVMHKRRHDYRDFGFTVEGRIEPLLTPNSRPSPVRPSTYSTWVVWRDYLERQDASLEVSGASGRTLSARRT